MSTTATGPQGDGWLPGGLEGPGEYIPWVRITRADAGAGPLIARRREGGGGGVVTLEEGCRVENEV